MTQRMVVRIGAVLALTALLQQSGFAQCAMCRRALLSPEGQQIAGAFRSGILFLLAAPFAVFAIVATLAVRQIRRRAALNATDEAVTIAPISS